MAPILGFLGMAQPVGYSTEAKTSSSEKDSHSGLIPLGRTRDWLQCGTPSSMACTYVRIPAPRRKNPRFLWIVWDDDARLPWKDNDTSGRGSNWS
jgi:hypothetical protein